MREIDRLHAGDDLRRDPVLGEHQGARVHGKDEAFFRGVSEKLDVLAKRRTSADDESGNVFILLGEAQETRRVGEELEILEHVGYPLARSDAVRRVVDDAPLNKLGNRLAQVAVLAVVEVAVAGSRDERDIVSISAKVRPKLGEVVRSANDWKAAQVARADLECAPAQARVGLVDQNRR